MSDEILNIFASSKRNALKAEAAKGDIRAATEAYADQKEHEATFGRRPAEDYGWGTEDDNAPRCDCGEEMVAFHHLSSKLVCLVCDA
ncbi:MAG: eS27 family ribosomal protein [Planctomycetota bacterium]|jgi:hypothetical protein